ncbi:hypothetical protein [Cytobacillus dafuensis]|uniref:Uncharacterized protein n=1 Tax=Cytobacillus dafuensis TaxID=1742359 RepID=A0A5B8Z6V8_CYTDA|nr:hypothetical protein [Cytobacillus dafuensis]QED48667.1 hypothetical protein FSZ17_16200 [Cytobacillus dafuensis]
MGCREGCTLTFLADLAYDLRWAGSPSADFATGRGVLIGEPLGDVARQIESEQNSIYEDGVFV